MQFETLNADISAACYQILTIKALNESWEGGLSYDAWIITAFIVLYTENIYF